jgi:N-acetylneuraminic acid mutarotase
MQKLNTLLLCILSIQTLTAQWSTTKLPHPRTRMEGALIDNKVYYAGGYSQIDPQDITSNAVDVHDLGTSTWSSMQLSVPRAGMAMTQLGNKVYFMGANAH